MKKRNRIVLLLAAGLTLVSALACAQHARHGDHSAKVKKFVSQRVDHVLSDIDATDAQRKEVLRVKNDLFAEFERALAGSRETKRTLLNEWKSDKPDGEKLHALVDQRMLAYQKAIHESIDGMLEVHATLDKKQRAEITERIEKRLGD